MDEKRPLVSVVIPFYKGVDWLADAVDSVLCQTYSNYEIIIVNDGSQEDVSDFLAKYSDKTEYFYQENAGPGKARNRALQSAKGEYIAFLDSDDLWLPEKLEKQIEYMEKNPDIMWSHTAYKTFGFGDEKLVDNSYFSGNVFPRCFASCPVATPCVIIRKRAFDENEFFRFSETMRFGQDFYLWVLLSYKYEIGALKEAHSKVRMRGSNAAKRAYVMLKAKSELLDTLEKTKMLPLNEISAPVRLSYKWCRVGFRFISATEKLIKSKNIIELFSKAVYVLPYVILKMYK